MKETPASHLIGETSESLLFNPSISEAIMDIPEGADIGEINAAIKQFSERSSSSEAGVAEAIEDQQKALQLAEAVLGETGEIPETMGQDQRREMARSHVEKVSEADVTPELSRQFS